MMDAATTRCPGCGIASSENYDGAGACWSCVNARHTTADGTEPNSNGAGPAGEDIEVAIVSLEAFTDTEEEGAAAIVGTADCALIAEGSDVMFYGDGGAAKTTLTVDLAFHLATPKDWLGHRIERAVRVLIIENEGPRPLFRRKLKRKREAWGETLDGRIQILERPWAQFTFATPEWREQLATQIRDHNVDVLIVGPLTRIGMDAAGTLTEVREFMKYVRSVRDHLARSLVVILIHHENKGGSVSGAWEGAGDTLLHLSKHGHGTTGMYVQKARWASEVHDTTIELVWTDGEGFAIKDERDLHAEMLELLQDHTPRTVKEMMVTFEAGETTIKQVIKDHAGDFILLTREQAKAADRRPDAKLYQLAPDVH